ncbi:MAG: hypothetical protein AAF437_00080 [Pseudomonadota bacterium]
MLITVIFGAVFLVFGLLLPFTIGALSTDKLIEYEGRIEKSERYRTIRRNRVYVTVLYDGGHREKHRIGSALFSDRLDAIHESLSRARDETVILSFLPNDRTLAEIRTASDEILLPQAQLRASTFSTALGAGGFGLLFLVLGALQYRRLSRPRTLETAI